MRLTEPMVVRKVYELIIEAKAGLSSLKYVGKRKSLTGGRYEKVIEEYFGREVPKPAIETDLVFVFEDLKKVIDEVLIVGVEVKYFEEDRLDKKLRKGFREFGQPLRYLAFGFDTAVLWHMFGGNVGDAKAKGYTETVGEVVKKLELAMVYFASRMEADKFRVYKPLDLESLHEISYVIKYLRRLCDNMRNPLTTKDEEIRKRRSALKVDLGLPS